MSSHLSATIVTLKAYGDFLIAYSAMSRAIVDNPAVDIRLLAGEHVRSLGLALGVPEAKVEYVGGSALKDVPAAFDVSRRGLWAAGRSLLSLRGAVHGSQFGRRELLFDRLGPRERLISGGGQCVALPPEAPNIYLAYDAHFLVGADLSPRLKVIGGVRRAVIVPASRVARKVLPASVIATVHQQLVEREITPHVLLLEGEQVEVPQSIDLVRVPRDFSTLISCLREADIVVSADSLPAHIGEHLGKPTFVISPTPNPYWLPMHAFLQGGHAVFNDPGNLSNWLDRVQYHSGPIQR